VSAFYDRMEATAQRLIGNYGQNADIVREGAPTGPPHDPQPGAPTRHPCRMVETEYSLTNRDTTLVLQGDKLGIISTAGLSIVPTKDDDLEVDGDVYHMVDLQPLRPGGQTLLYEFHARR
jgi:hypothetical protein